VSLLVVGTENKDDRENRRPQHKRAHQKDQCHDDQFPYPNHTAVLLFSPTDCVQTRADGQSEGLDSGAAYQWLGGISPKKINKCVVFLYVMRLPARVASSAPARPGIMAALTALSGCPAKWNQEDLTD